MNIEYHISQIPTKWKDILHDLVQPYKEEINDYISNEYLNLTEDFIFPPKKVIFNAFHHFEPEDLKVIIIGQDTYHNIGQANGLCFSVNEGIKTPPSLRNIFKELERCYETKRINTDLTDWSKQGVLLLNVGLTVGINKPGKHIHIWRPFIEKILEYINNNNKKICVMAWGNFAKDVIKNINKENNLILTYTHPSPLSRHVFECNHFIECNKYLEKEIKWI